MARLNKSLRHSISLTHSPNFTFTHSQSITLTHSLTHSLTHQISLTHRDRFHCVVVPNVAIFKIQFHKLKLKGLRRPRVQRARSSFKCQWSLALCGFSCRIPALLRYGISTYEGRFQLRRLGNNAQTQRTARQGCGARDRKCGVWPYFYWFFVALVYVYAIITNLEYSIISLK